MDEIASDLTVSINTLKSHIRSIYSKLGVSSRRCAVLTAHALRLILSSESDYESVAHPAKMLPAVAAHAIATYTRPGDLVLDPMCGSAPPSSKPSTWAAARSGWSTRSGGPSSPAPTSTSPGRRGAGVFTGDARHLDYVLPPDLLGQAPLWSPPRRRGPPPTATTPPTTPGCTSATISTGTCSTAAGNLAKSAAATGVYSARNALGHSPGTCTAPLAPSPAYLVVDGTVEWLGAQP